MRCSFCRGEAVYEARYSGARMCRYHFTESVERRVKREIRAQMDLKGNTKRIAVAVSGGKDSSTLLFLLHKILGNRKNVEIFSFTIDEGIEGYRPPGVESARRLSERLGVEHRVLSYREAFGATLDDMVKMDSGRTIPCSICGPMRRRLINEASLRIGADYVALGTNLDDYAQSILMNVFRGDVARMARLGPHSTVKEGLVPRVFPLRLVPEKEVMLYAILNGIEFDAGWCPYYSRAQRNEFRDILNSVEERSPGTKFSIVRFYDGIRDILADAYQAEGLGHCRVCGSPSSSDVCPVCSFLERVKGSGVPEQKG
ncbi:tRNA lysidine(34) synthetase TilS [Thermogymnomonas acidicola]|uniref:tRNA lysidine(34) synthetase TilS n=1 Tax=Thermogymnomonas acidicola TaxID=399579 RepID=A0AA37BQX5_9ARCH|nr:TIGR00269 family protein [Thermogymnomonas acidicola]GGM71908.1 tRNA lysidine(34) synthetase TilS [Thermogymnomonas acidicola]